MPVSDGQLVIASYCQDLIFLGILLSVLNQMLKAHNFKYSKVHDN